MRLLLCLLLVSVVGASAQRNKYTTKYDNVDVDRIISNDRILTSYIKCMMDEGPCTAEGRELKKTLPDALKSDCSQCNEMQKKTAEKVINHMRTARAKDWDRLIKKYDPTGQYKKHFEELEAKAAADAASSTPKSAASSTGSKTTSTAAKVEAAPTPTPKAKPTTPKAKPTTPKATVTTAKPTSTSTSAHVVLED